MSENTALLILALTLIVAAVALIVCGYGGWVVGALLVFFVFMS